MRDSGFIIQPGDIDLIVYDFDGVMTDNKVLVLEDGREGVFCNRSDGLAVQKIKNIGIKQIILSTEQNDVVKLRAQKLKIESISGVDDKKTILINYCNEKNIDLKKVIYIGNDINDLEAMKLVGYPIVPQDANEKVKAISKIIIEKNGGEGVIRIFFETILKLG